MTVHADQLKLVHYPDPVLRSQTQVIETVNDQVRQVAAKMLQIMRQACGVGLAAPQVGLSWRIFVANPTGQPQDDQVFINPVIAHADRNLVEHEEGCLSLPNVTGMIRRPASVTVEALDLKGNRVSMTGQGLAARIWQHEQDHLEGILIIDRMTEIDRMANQSAVRDLERACQQR